jgi:hypothetical protein
MSCVTVAFLLPGWQLIQIFNTNLYQNTDYECKKLTIQMKHHKIETLSLGILRECYISWLHLESNSTSILVQRLLRMSK